MQTTTTRRIMLGLALAGTVAAFASPEARPITPVPLDQDSRQVVEITMSNPTTHPKLGVPDFVLTSTDPELGSVAKVVADVLWNDLDFEREFYMIARNATASIPAARAEALPYQQWMDIGADAVLVAEISRSGADMALDVRVIRVRGDQQGKQEYGARFPNCRVQNPRACAHAVADEVHRMLRALDGVARTKLAFSSDRQGARVAGRPSQTAAASKEIYISDYDGANQMRVTVNGSINNFPAWSPSGDLLSYVSWQSGVPDIYVANLAQPGQVFRPAAGKTPSSNWTHAWSPDGSRLAFSSTRTGEGDIWIVNRDGSGLQNLTNSPRSYEGTPTWSPSGTQIAFTSDRTGQNQLYVMSATGTGVQRLVDQLVDRPTWSPLDFIAFTVGAGPGHDIAIYDFSSGGAVKVLTDGIGSNESPAVAPNGRHIAFVTTRWGRRHIATIDRRGENIRQITEVGNNEAPNWQGIAR